MKGVSPVIATVLLIAIAVVAAVSVWFLVSEVVTKPPTSLKTKMLRFDKCILVDPNNNNHTTLILSNPTPYNMNISISGVEVVDSNYQHVANVTSFGSVPAYGKNIKVKLDTVLKKETVYYLIFSKEAENLPTIEILCQ